jgi:ribosome-associated translation inhibitor RaiA
MVPTRIVTPHGTIAPALAEDIRERASHLGRYFDRLTACRVTVEVGSRRGRDGVQYRVVIEMLVPGRELVARRRHADPEAAVQEAFHAARRRLVDYARRLREPVSAVPAV